MTFVRFSSVFVILLTVLFSTTTMVNSRSTSSSEDLSSSGSESEDVSYEESDHSSRKVVKALDVELEPYDYTPQELNLDELKDHPNYEEIKKLDKASLQAITMLARKKRSAKRNTLSKTLRFRRNIEQDDIRIPDPGNDLGDSEELAD